MDSGKRFSQPKDFFKARERNFPLEKFLLKTFFFLPKSFLKNHLSLKKIFQSDHV